MLGALNVFYLYLLKTKMLVRYLKELKYVKYFKLYFLINEMINNQKINVSHGGKGVR